MFHLQPVIYGKAKTKSKICSNLQKAPLQLCNSPEAFDGLVMEFRPENKFDVPVGVLSEYLDADTDFAIHTVDNFIVYVHYGPSNIPNVNSFRVTNVEYEVKIDVDNVDGEFVISDNDIGKIEMVVSESDVDTIVENNGVGPYEFWGFCGNDRGVDYLAIDGQTETCVTVNLKNGVIDENDLKRIWNDIIVDNIQTDRTLSKGGNEREEGLELECKLVAEFAIENPVRGRITLKWDDQ